MTDDEKVCPFCAEVIKAAAIKCRFCQSDLPVDLPVDPPADEPSAEQVDEPVSETELETEPEAESEPEPELEAQPEAEPALEPALPAPTKKRPDLVVLALALVCVLLLGSLITIVLASRPGDLAVADNGQVTSDSYRSAALSAASTSAATILSYSHDSLDEDLKSARAVMVPAYAASDYDKSMAGLRAGILSKKLVQTAKVLSVSLTSLTRTHATLLLLTNVTVAASGSKDAAPQSLYRVQMTMVRKDGDWFVSNMSSL